MGCSRAQMTASCSWKVQSGCSGCNGMAGMAVAASRQRPPCISFTCAVAGTLVEPHRARVRPAQRPRNRVPILGCAIRVIDAKTKAGSRKVRAKPAPHAHAARARSRPSRSQEYFCPRMNGWKRPGRQMRVTHRGHAMPQTNGPKTVSSRVGSSSRYAPSLWVRRTYIRVLSSEERVPAVVQEARHHGAAAICRRRRLLLGLQASV